MIPAVIKISGKILPKAYRANELLNKKVKIWMENDYSSRYLLGWRELWLIEQHKQYLIWGTKQRQKQTLLQQSKRRLYRNFGILGSIGLLVMGVWGWLNYTMPGQMWQIRRDLAYWSGRVQDDEYQSKAAIAFAKDGKVGQMNQLLEQIEDSSDKARALSAIAEAQANLHQWGTALKTTRQCPSYDCRVDSLSRVLTAYAEWQHPELKEKEE